MSLSLDYAVRMLGYGQTLSPEGAAAIDDLETLITAESVTLRNGWLGGGTSNLSTGARILDLQSSTPRDFVHSGTGTLHVGAGMTTLESESTAAYFDCGAPIFTNDSWTILMIVDKPTRNSNSGSPEASMPIHQYAGFAAGQWYVNGNFTGATTFTLIQNSSHVYISIGGGSNLSAPAVVWCTYDHSIRQVTFYNAFTGAQLGQATIDDLGSGNGWGTTNMRLGGSIQAPRICPFVGSLKFDGVLDGTKRTALFPTCYDVMTRFTHKVGLWGNSVTSGSDAGLYSASWAGQFKVHLAKNNGLLWQPPNMGAKSLYHHRPTGYAVEPGREALNPLVAINAETSVDGYADKGINILVIDENQNTAASLGANANTLYSDFVHVLEAIADSLRATQPNLKIICGTQMAWWARDLATATTDLTYAQVAADSLRVKHRDWSQQTRADVRFDRVADVYAVINMGWDTEDDGNLLDPENDLPNGDSSLFLDDIQHPNQDGHALIFAAFREAYDAMITPQTSPRGLIGSGYGRYYGRSSSL